jgi:hypothetical protein
VLTSTSTSVPADPMPAIDLPTTRTARLDTESQDWIDRLGAHGSQRDTAIAALHALLLKAARYEMPPAA